MEKQSAKWIEFCRLYKQLTEAIDMAKKTKAQLNRIKRAAEKKAQEHMYSVHVEEIVNAELQNGCVAAPAEEVYKRAKSPFDIQFHYNHEGGHIHLSFHGLE